MIIIYVYLKVYKHSGKEDPEPVRRVLSGDTTRIALASLRSAQAACCDLLETFASCGFFFPRTPIILGEHVEATCMYVYTKKLLYTIQIGVCETQT